ncbi:hypothetical protein ACFV4F_35450 [Kitasatospora sp. NPDC059722]|uniref:protein kinase domain-containing protein n=1 Tax=Kitasatospora sp. NPDC059722 TaxID=3346925 RepID=UPI00368D2A4A
MRTGMELADRYELAGLIGRGGMGEVWRATDRRLRRPVAVKILPLAAGADATEVARFRREAEIAAQLVHPGITTVFDVGEHHDGTQPLLFLVVTPPPREREGFSLCRLGFATGQPGP